MSRIKPSPAAIDFTSEEWKRIKENLTVLKPSSLELEHAEIYLRDAVRHYIKWPAWQSELETEYRRQIREWTKVMKLTEQLSSVLTPLNDEQIRHVSPPLPYNGILEELASLQHKAQYLVQHFNNNKLKKPYPNGNPKFIFQFDVLDLWLLLGGQLRFSRNMGTGKITGPLARYFNAVAHPIVGGQLASLPDILKRYKRWRMAVPNRLIFGLRSGSSFRIWNRADIGKSD